MIKYIKRFKLWFSCSVIWITFGGIKIIPISKKWLDSLKEIDELPHAVRYGYVKDEDENRDD